MSFGKTYLLEVDGCIYDGWFVLRDFEKSYNKDFLLQQLNSDYLQKQYKRLSAGGVVQNISSEIVYSTYLIKPTLPEQQKIASIFTAIDQKISQLKKKKDLLEQYKKGVMQKIFSQQIRFKDDDGREFPKWEKKRLGDFLVHKSLRNKNNKTTLVLSVSNTRGFIAQSDQFDNHRVASVDVSNYKIVSQNDFAYNPSRINVGSIARLTNYSEGIVSPMYAVFGFKQRLDAGYFENLIKTHKFKFLVKTSCSGSVRDSLNFDDLCEFVFNFPSLPEQTKIATFLSAIDDKIHHTQKQVEQAEHWKKGLMQLMFC
jgi:type I restriction enzyme S subunit